MALLNFLLRPCLPLWQYCLVMWPLAMIPSLLLVALVIWVGGLFGLTALTGPDRTVNAADLLGSILIAPLLETLLIPVGLTLLRVFTRRSVVLAIGSAMLWGLSHGLLAPGRFAGSAWSFFVFSCAYMAWREHGFWRALAAAGVPHALVNATAFTFLLLDR